MKKKVFVAGTDTGVGKTLVSAIMAMFFKEKGIDVGVMKPFETGAKKYGGEMLPEDASTLKAVAGVDDPLDLICPYCFETPASPAEAARVEGKRVDLKKVKEALEELSRRHDLLIVEGAGGLLVPVAEGVLYSDLLKELGLDVILVSRNCLGTINHTLLSLYYCKREGIKVLGYVLNKVNSKGDGTEDTNPTWIKAFTDVPFLGRIPYLGDVKSYLEARDLLLPFVFYSFDFGLLAKVLGFSD